MIGIGSNCPTTKLEIRGFSKFDTVLIRILKWYFNKKGFSFTVFNKSYNNPSDRLYIVSNGNVGIGV